MGQQCDTRLTRNQSNDCTAETISGFDRNFCTIASALGVGYGLAFCEGIGDDEFVPNYNSQYSCFYNDGTLQDRWDTVAGCCGYECAIAGAGNDCTRKFRRGLSLSCCFRDQACSGINNVDPLTVCYDSDSTERSCPLNATDMASSTCQGLVLPLCSNPNNDPTNQWRANWLTNRTVTQLADPATTGGRLTEELSYTTPANPICLHTLYRNVYGVNGYGCNGTAPPTLATGIQAIPTADGLAFGQQMVQDLFNTYIAAGGNIFANEGQQGDTEMNDLLWGICSTIPGVCTTSLQQICSTVTTQDLIDNPEYQRWCSCYMPDFEYAKYTDLYGISKQCTPQCNQRNVIPLTNQTGIQIALCQQSTCVIDNVSIDLYQSKVGTAGSGAGLNFSQICGSCGGGNNTGTCACTLTGLTFEAAEAAIGGIDISQQCGAGSTCYLETQDTLGNTVSTPVPCTDENNVNPYLSALATSNAIEAAAQRSKRSKVLILFGLVFILLIILWFFVAPRDVIETTRIYRQPAPYAAPAKPTELISLPLAQTSLVTPVVSTSLPVSTNASNPVVPATNNLPDINIVPTSIYPY